MNICKFFLSLCFISSVFLCSFAEKPDTSLISPEMLKQVQEMMKSEDMQKMIRFQLEETTQTLWGDFFETLEDSEATKLKTLFVDHLLDGASNGMALLSQNKKERKGLSKEMRNSAQKQNAEIKALLGEDKYQKYLEYQESMGARQKMAMLEDFGFNMPDAAGRDMVLRMMNEVDQDFRDKDLKEMEEKILEEGFSEKSMLGLMESEKEAHAEYLIRSKSMLSDDEYSSFKKSLEMYESTMEVGKDMLPSMFAK